MGGVLHARARSSYGPVACCALRHAILEGTGAHHKRAARPPRRHAPQPGFQGGWGGWMSQNLLQHARPDVRQRVRGRGMACARRARVLACLPCSIALSTRLYGHVAVHELCCEHGIALLSRVVRPLMSERARVVPHARSRRPSYRYLELPTRGRSRPAASGDGSVEEATGGPPRRHRTCRSSSGGATCHVERSGDVGTAVRTMVAVGGRRGSAPPLFKNQHGCRWGPHTARRGANRSMVAPEALQ